MASTEDEDGRAALGEPDLRGLSQSLLRAIEAEPVPEAILALARALDEALAARQGLERVEPAVLSRRQD